MNEPPKEAVEAAKLLPCPFCGTRPVIDYFGGIRCDNPECFGPETTASGADAEVQWNTRATPAPALPGEEIERRTEVLYREVYKANGCTLNNGDAVRNVLRATLSRQPAPGAEGWDKTGCEDCGRSYGNEHGFPDLIIPYDFWKQISPTGDDGGLLCPSCICKRLTDKGLHCEGAFMSGPIQSVSRTTMNNLRRVENIELAIQGRDNAWSAIRSLARPTTDAQTSDSERRKQHGKRTIRTAAAAGPRSDRRRST